MFSAAIGLASLILRLLQMLLFLRAILSWFPLDSNNPVVRIVYSFTEPVMLPVRTLMFRLFPALQRAPIDFSFLVVYLLIEGLLSLL